jgi:hypothetical protein
MTPSFSPRSGNLAHQYRQAIHRRDDFKMLLQTGRIVEMGKNREEFQPSRHYSEETANQGG